MKTLRIFVIFCLIRLLFAAFEKWDLSFIWESFQTEEGRESILFNGIIYLVIAMLYVRFEKQVDKFLGL